MTVLRAIARPFVARVQVSGLAIILLAASAVLGNIGQYVDRDRAEAQLKSFRAAASLDNEEDQCRGRLDGYVDVLNLEKDLALGDGVLDRIGVNDDAVYLDAQERYGRAVTRLKVAKGYIERAVEVCAEDPGFDPQGDIP